MDCNETQKLLSEYSLDLVQGKTKVRIQEHLAACPTCSAELTKLERVMALIDDLQPLEPPQGLWNGVYNRITSPEAEHKVRQPAWGFFRRPVYRWVACLAAVLFVAIFTFSRAHYPGPQEHFVVNEYVQSHVTTSSQDFLSDTVSLNSAETLDDRDDSDSDSETL